MKTWILLLIATLFSLSACKKDQGPDVPSGLVAIHFDDNNLDAPSLPAGTFEAGVRFNSAMMQNYAGAKLEIVQYYIKDIPRSAELRIYSLSEANAPKDLLYSAGITAEIDQDSWMNHSLSTPLTLDGQDLWVAIRFNTLAAQRTVGCDPGPAVENGDWLWDQADDEWRPLRQRAAVDINWNIRALVRE